MAESHILCESFFDSAEEYLFYVASDHQLILRRKPDAQEYEVWKRYWRLAQEQRVFHSKDLQEALDFASKQILRHGKKELFKVCEHQPPNIDAFCFKFNAKGSNMAGGIQ